MNSKNIKKIERQNKRRVSKKNRKKKTTNSWIWMKHFSMKWRFRLDQARAIFGLVTFAILLAAAYVPKLPWFKDQTSFWTGEFVLGIIIFIIFLIGGYLYDRLFKLWTETQTVNIERNPFTYVPSPKEYINNLAIFSFLFSSLSQIAKKLDVDLKGEELIRLHLKTYYDLNTKVTNFEIEALKLQKLSKALQQIFIESGEIEDYDKFFSKVIEKAKKADRKDKKATELIKE